jgi:hypothetical protein
MTLNFPVNPSNGDIYDNYIWIESEDAWRRLTTPPNTRLNNLEDISIVTPVDGEVLIYDSASGEWVNETPVTTLGSLTDVNVDGVESGNSLVYDADNSEWTAGEAAIAVDDLSAIIAGRMFG